MDDSTDGMLKFMAGNEIASQVARVASRRSPAVEILHIRKNAGRFCSS